MVTSAIVETGPSMKDGDSITSLGAGRVRVFEGGCELSGLGFGFGPGLGLLVLVVSRIRWMILS